MPQGSIANPKYIFDSKIFAEMEQKLKFYAKCLEQYVYSTSSWIIPWTFVLDGVTKCFTIKQVFQEGHEKRMRINKEKLRDIMAQKNLTEETICIRSGIYRKSLQWILDNGFVSEEALERIADAAEVKPEEIYLSDFTAYMENTIEFARDSSKATVTLSQGRYKSKILRLAAERPDECEIVAENKDGSLCAHIPVAWVRIIPTQQLTDEQREERAEAMRKNLLNNVNNRNEKG